MKIFLSVLILFSICMTSYATKLTTVVKKGTDECTMELVQFWAKIQLTSAKELRDININMLILSDEQFINKTEKQASSIINDINHVVNLFNKQGLKSCHIGKKTFSVSMCSEVRQPWIIFAKISETPEYAKFIKMKKKIDDYPKCSKGIKGYMDFYVTQMVSFSKKTTLNQLKSNNHNSADIENLGLKMKQTLMNKCKNYLKEFRESPTCSYIDVYGNSRIFIKNINYKCK